MFNLEQSILEWRARMLSEGLKGSDILDELESHLREDCALRVESGESEEQAFLAASLAIGRASLLKHEFAKIPGKTWAWLHKLRGALAGDGLPALSAFSPGALRTLELARQEAPRLHHGFVGTEHVLIGLLALEEGVVPKVLKRMGVDREAVRREIDKWVGVFPASKTSEEPAYTPRVQKSLRLAATEAKVSKHGNVGAEHILLGLILERDGVAGRVLRDCGLSAETARKEIMSEVDREE